MLSRWKVLNHEGHEVHEEHLDIRSVVILRVLRGSSSSNQIVPPQAFLSVHNVLMTVRRLKTYTAAQGYVYQYYFVGKRPAIADDPEAPATEFIFDVTSDRKLTYSVSVFLPDAVRSAWGEVHARALNDAEQYAAAKLRLFRAFDELEDVKSQGRRLTLDATLLEEALSSLGVE